MRSRTFFLALCVVLASAPVSAEEWGTNMSREQALAQLHSADSSARREGLVRLAEIGTGEDVPYMLQRLHDNDSMVRGMAEQALWGLWLRSNDRAVNRMFQSSLALIQRQENELAIDKLDRIIAYRPEFAEAWNKRGDAYMHLGEFDRALADYQETLRLNPYHFGAMQSCGEIWLERSNTRRSAEYFRRALDVNPNLQEAAIILHELEERLEDDRI
jgi:tetratricopeptide (TPR) repeat protein